MHPSSLLFRALAHGKSYLLPALLVLLLARGGSWELWLAALFAPVMVYEVIQYIRQRYWLTDEELVVRDGGLFFRERHIPYQRIQNLDVSRSLLHRWLGVAEVKVETASGAEPEAVLRVIPVAEMEALRRASNRSFRPAPVAADGADVAPDGDPAERELLVLRPLELLLLGLDPGRGVALAFVLGGIAWDLDLLDWSSATILALPLIQGQVPAWLNAGISLCVIVLLLGALWTLVQLYGFRLTETDRGFGVRYGLLTDVHALIPAARVQLVQVRQSPLLRLFGRVTVRVTTASVDQVDNETRWFAPLVKTGKLAELLREVDPRIDLEAAAWQGLSRRAWHRSRRDALILCALIVPPICYLWVPAGFWSALLVPLLLFLQAWQDHRFTAWARTPFGLLHRTGAWYRKWSVTFDDRTQSVAVHRGPLDRRWGMASLVLDVAGGSEISGESVTIDYLDNDQAWALGGSLARRTAATELPA